MMRIRLSLWTALLTALNLQILALTSQKSTCKNISQLLILVLNLLLSKLFAMKYPKAIYIISATKPTVVNALGAIPKPNSSEVRLIYDCSPPHGQAVKLLGPNYFMAILWLKNKRRKLKNEKMYTG